jgi:hypothetical protein
VKRKLILNKCEIEGCNETQCLHLHHIIERTEENTTNNIFNLCILCPTHHAYVHSGRLKIYGILPSTQLPNKRTVIYELDGKKNLDIDGPFIDFKLKSYKINNLE